jgi:hypothetical protein
MVLLTLSVTGCTAIGIEEFAHRADEFGYVAPDSRLDGARTVEQRLDDLAAGTLAGDLVGQWAGTLLDVDYGTGQWKRTPGVSATFGDDGTYSMNLADISETGAAPAYDWAGTWFALGDGLLVLVAGDGPTRNERVPFVVARDGHRVSLLPVQNISDIIVFEERLD